MKVVFLENWKGKSTFKIIKRLKLCIRTHIKRKKIYITIE